MFNRFTKEARLVVGDSIRVARDLGAPSVEAEHLLLAIAGSDAPVAHVLGNAGLDFDGLSEALHAETARSLAAVGVTATTPHFTRFPSKPRFATSAKVTLEGALKIAAERRDKQISAGHVVLAALRPNRGTVPRALELAGVDRNELGAAISSVT